MQQLINDFFDVFDKLAEFEGTQRHLRGMGVFNVEELDKVQDVVRRFKAACSCSNVKQHNRDVSGNTFNVHCVDNGFIINSFSGTQHSNKVCTGIEEVINEMTRHFNLSKIGEKVRIY